MMHQALIALTCPQSHFQGLCHRLGLQAVVHMPAYDLARVGICDQTQVDELVVRGQVGDVSHPHLLAARGTHLLLALLE